MPSAPDTTMERAARWLAEHGIEVVSLAPLAGDVSARRYLRLRSGDGGSHVVALYPPAALDGCSRFLVTSKTLTEAGIRVPRVEAADCGAGVVVLEDLGDRTLYDERDTSWAALGPRIAQAAHLIDRLQRIPRERVAELNPPLAEALLRRELEQTWELFLLPHDLAGDRATRSRLAAALAAICGRLGEEEPVVCHRDFMARNLVPLGSDLVVLDHQDLRLGPPAYDLASLLNDSLFAPPGLETDLVRRLAPVGVSADSYHRAAVQRTLKAIGTFTAFAQRGSAVHLRLVEPTLRRALSHLERLAETTQLAAALAPRWRSFRLATS